MFEIVHFLHYDNMTNIAQSPCFLPEAFTDISVVNIYSMFEQ